MEKKGWERVKGLLSKGYKWLVQYARRDKRKGRAVGRIIMGIRGEFEEIIEKRNREGVMRKVVKRRGKIWKMIGIYINGDRKEKLDMLAEWGEECTEEERVIIGGTLT